MAGPRASLTPRDVHGLQCRFLCVGASCRLFLLFSGVLNSDFSQHMSLLEFLSSVPLAFLEIFSGRGRGWGWGGRLSCEPPELGKHISVCILELFWDSCGFQETLEQVASFSSSLPGRDSVLGEPQYERFQPYPAL